MSEAAVTRLQLYSKGETVASKVRRLQEEARGLAKEHVQSLCTGLGQIQLIAAEIADGGDAYPAGVRDVARRMVEDCEARVQTLEAIVARGGQ